MTQSRQATESRRSVVIQKNRICNLGQVRYQLANALGEYALTHDFKNAIRQLPMNYSVSEYVQFLDDWGTVSENQAKSIYYFYRICLTFSQHVIETADIGTRTISRSRVSYLQVYEFLSQQVRN